MKTALLVFILLFPVLLVAQVRLDFDSLSFTSEKLTLIDSALDRADSLDNFALGLILTKQGLDLAEEDKNIARQARYHIKLAKYFYRLDQVEEALVQFRLYALLNETLIRHSLTRDMIILEDAYLDELARLHDEMNLDKKLIENLQKENERYYIAQKRIGLAVRIGLIALALVVIIWLYNKISRSNQETKKAEDQNMELQRLRDMMAKLQEEQERNLTSISGLRDQIKANTSYARNMQFALLKNSTIDAKKVKQSFVFELPRNRISGDFFITYHTGNKSIVAVVDCPGRGVDASYSTITLNEHFLEALNNGITAPSMLLTLMDQKLKHEYERASLDPKGVNGVRLAICEIDNKTKEVEFAGAQFPIFYVHLDKTHMMKGNKFPIGDPVFTDKFYSSDHIRLSNGDMLYFSTDGFYNQIGGTQLKRFTRVSFTKLVESMHLQTLPEQKFVLEKVYKEWKGSNPQTDDILVLGIRL